MPTDYTDLEKVVSEGSFTVKQYLANNGIFIDYNTVEGLALAAWIFKDSNGLWQLARQQNDILLPQMFPQTATLEFLEAYHGNEFSVTRRTTKEATGEIIFEGTDGTTVSLATQAQVLENSYETTQVKTISSTTIDVTSIVVAGGVATVTLSEEIAMGSGMHVSITGATPSELNVTDEAINVTANDEFRFSTTAAPGTASGTIEASFTYASIPCASIGTGSSYNIANNTTLTLVNPVANINDECYAEFSGFVDGADLETDANYKTRILDITQNIPQGFNASNIETVIKSFDNNRYADAKVFVPRAEKTDGSIVGSYTTVYFLKADNVIPIAGELAEIKDYLLATIYQAYAIDDRLNVVAPTPNNITVRVALDSGFDTTAMRNAVNESVRNMFLDDTIAWFRQDIRQDTFKQQIRQSFDDSGIFLEDNYTLNLPSSDVTLAYNEFPFLNGGEVEFV